MNTSPARHASSWELIEQCSDLLPVLLLPVRIEARFVFEGADAELWLRVLPDDIALTSNASQSTSGVMPDCFVALGYVDGVEVFRAEGRPIPDPLVCAAEPVDWQRDFEAAVALGMAMRIRLPAAAHDGLDRVLVLGVRTSSDAAESVSRLEALLDAHRNSAAGLGLVPIGAPTKDGAAGAASPSNGCFEVSDDWRSKSDGQWLAEALGIAPAVLAGVEHADGRDQADARAMNRALFPATIGYFSEEMMAPLFGPTSRAFLRELMTHYVLGRGSVPSLRVGDQPYGVLPTTAWSRWRGGDAISPELRERVPQLAARIDRLPGLREAPHGYMATLCARLSAMRADWATMAEQVSHVGAPGDASAHVLDALGLHASSQEFHQRFVVGFHYIWNLLDSRRLTDAAVDLDEFLGSWRGDTLRELGLDAAAPPEIMWKVLFEQATLLDGPLIDERPPSETEPLLPISANDENYIAWLADHGLDTIRSEDFGIRDDQVMTPPRSLLYLLLRHAALLAWWDGAMQLQHGHGQIMPAARREHQLLYIDVSAAEQAARSKYAYLYERNHAITHAGDELTVAEHMENLLWDRTRLEHTPQLRELAELRADLSYLASRPTAKLERAFTEHLDVCSYRLDAWRAGLVSHRLQQLRTLTSEPRGVYLGAYGWLEPLRPQHRTGPRTGPVSAGFVHAPSLAHARTAALLHDAATDAGSMNLSSARVRAAVRVLDGVREGQSLGELLGHQFERNLHDRHGLDRIDAIIHALRRAFPQSADDVEAREVMDGLALLEHARASGASLWPFEHARLAGLEPPPTAAQQAAIEVELANLHDTLDAVADLALAECVHQSLLGNDDRAEAMMQAIEAGELPPRPEIVDTPRSGMQLNHRVALLLRADLDALAPAANPYGELFPMTARARFEPALNLWLAARLPPPSRVAVVVRWRSSRAVVSFAQLRVQAIDLIMIDAAQLELRIIAVIRELHGLADDVPVKIDHGSREGLDSAQISAFELAPLIDALRRLIAGARALTADDLRLRPANEASGELAAHGELERRVRVLVAEFSALRGALDEALVELAGEPTPAAAFERVRVLLRLLAEFGFDNAFPRSQSGIDALACARLLSQGRSLAAQLDAAHEACRHALAGDGGVQGLIDAARALLGREFVVLPSFSLGVGDIELQRGLAESTSLLADEPEPLAIDEWLHSIARVRRPMQALEQAVLMTDNFATGEIELDVMQLPWRANDRWLGNRVPDGYARDGDRLLLTLGRDAPFEPGVARAGLLIDEWTELVPDRDQQTGLAFQFNRPTSRPANALLLAVSPQLTGAWAWDDLVATLHETLDDARGRLVEPAHIDASKYAQLLPAIMLAATRHGITISTNLMNNLEHAGVTGPPSRLDS